jgi:hypothetical protein
MSITMEERLARLDAAIAENRVVYGLWRHVEDDGCELVCLLAALSPEVAEAKNTASCPAEVMPAWLARLTPLLHDCVSAEYRPELIRRYAGLAHRWHVLDVGAWQRCAARAAAARVAAAATVKVAGDKAAWDRMAAAILDAIEAEIERAEA